MGNLFLSVFLLITSFVVFITSFEITGMNRVIINTPRDIFETVIPVITDEEEITVFFDPDELSEKLTSYYDYNLSKYVPEYQMSIFYYNPEDGSYCTSGKCQGVEVTVEAELCFAYSFSRTVYYEIRRSNG